MASIQRIDGKTGPSFKITVTQGRNLAGKQLRHYRTWTPEPGMTERQMRKAAEKAALNFEREIALGFQADNRQTFAQYADYVIDLKARTGAKHKTIHEYKQLTARTYAAIGHIRLADLRPQHLKAFYKNLGEAGVRQNGQKAQAAVDLAALLREKGLTREKLAQAAGISPTTVTTACRGGTISPAKAAQIAAALETPLADLFRVERDTTPLSSRSLLAYHRFIHTVLDQAEREMLVPYNAAAKATPPKLQKKAVNYFQPVEIAAILDALEGEPLKWRASARFLQLLTP